jgi:hypothetical protein
MKINELKINPVVTKRLPQEKIEKPKQISNEKEITDIIEIKKDFSSEELLIRKTDIALERINEAKALRMKEIRSRVESGFYLSDEVTSNIADEIIKDQFEGDSLKS